MATDSDGLEAYLFHNGRYITSHSFWQTFNNCPALANYKWVKGLEPAFIPKDDPREFGKTWHNILERWRNNNPDDSWNDYVDSEYEDRDSNLMHRTLWHHQRAMMRGYHDTWGRLPWKSLHTEKGFNHAIINPEDGSNEGDWRLIGKIDVIVEANEPFMWGKMKCDPGWYVVEEKSARQIGDNYFQRLWADPQITLYANAVSKELGHKVQGVLYSVSRKPAVTLVLEPDETADEFQDRIEALRQQAEAGEMAKRIRGRKDETPESILGRRQEAGHEEVDGVEAFGPRKQTEDKWFAEQLDQFYDRPGSFAREVIMLSDDITDIMLRDLWQQTKVCEMRLKDNNWSHNWDFCVRYFRRCEFWKLCTTDDNPVILESDFRKRVRDKNQSLWEEAIF